MVNGRKPLCCNSFRQNPQRAADFRETPRTVFKTVEGAKVPWRVRFPSASARARQIRVFRALPSSSTTAPEPFGALLGAR